MATVISDIRGQLSREINVPGFEQFPDIKNSELDSYVKDGFWEARLLGMLEDYTITDGSELPVPPGEDVIKNASDDGDLEEWYQTLVVIIAGVRMVRMKLLNLAVNFRAKAGPVEYEQQASATTLRAILDHLQSRLDELKLLYSDEFAGGGFWYFDSTIQRDYALLDGLMELQV